MFELGLSNRTTHRSGRFPRAQVYSVQFVSLPDMQTPEQQRRTLRGSRADHGKIQLGVTERSGVIVLAFFFLVVVE